MRAVILMLAMGTALTTSCRACSHEPSSTPSTATTPAATGPDAGDAGEENENVRVPSVLPVPGTPSSSGLEMDVPLAWLFLRDAPAPTGSAPEVIVGAELPCGFHPVYANVSPPHDPLRVRLRARYGGPGRPTDTSVPCPTPNNVALIVSLQRLRLGGFTVTDATPHHPGDPPVPSLRLQVVEENERTPSPQVRHVRGCTPGDDATCTEGGVCGAVPGRTGAGVCVPPLDPFLSAGRACQGVSPGAPLGSVEVSLEHPGAYAMRAAPAPGALKACLPMCDDAHPCDASLACVPVGGLRVCLPR
jgi:hypothetical protein